MPKRLSVADTIAAIASLTEREKEVLLVLLGGRTNHDAGVALGLSGRTVEVHRRAIFKKLGAASSIQLGYVVGLVVANSGPEKRSHYP